MKPKPIAAAALLGALVVGAVSVVDKQSFDRAMVGRPLPGSVESLRERSGTVILVDRDHARVAYRGWTVPFVPAGPVACA
ncbi:MAG: hypothetical protein ACR2MY_09660 [Candidatus Dormibacteria bacterium]